MNPHIHEYKIDSKVTKGHKHRIRGYTESMLGINSFHIHFFYGVSSYSNHTHYFSGFTGFPIKTSNGHIHKIEDILEINNMHEHLLLGYTFEEIAYKSNPKLRGAFI
ncbi:MAG TPA: YmaF family protein [Pseudobacteroides sp.]|uniref:YmaF family protein n=1 Tax=Pseudobacteroides sp. TaxID=1968840 RepID=UPI002F94153D